MSVFIAAITRRRTQKSSRYDDIYTPNVTAKKEICQSSTATKLQIHDAQPLLTKREL